MQLKPSKTPKVVKQKNSKSTSAKKASSKAYKVSTASRHGQSKNIHGIVNENAMDQWSHKNKSGEVTLGFVSDAIEENKNQRLELRLTKLQKEIISKASNVSGFKNVSDYVLHIAITDSRNVIREQQILELSERDRISFMETLENPPKPGKNLKKAMADYLSFKEAE
jgi:uncharacterized protein (DUF1778 family)